jgi:hypothetical protein
LTNKTLTKKLTKEGVDLWNAIKNASGKTYQIGTCFSDDVIKLLKYQDKKQIKESSLVIINGIKLSTNDKNSLITKMDNIKLLPTYQVHLFVICVPFL